MDVEIKLTKEQADHKMRVFREIYQDVRLYDSRDLYTDDTVVLDVLKDKKQRTKLKYVGRDLYEILERYVEVDGVPCVMEMTRAIDTELIVQQEEVHLGEATPFYDLLYMDVVSGAQNRRFYEDCIKENIVTAGVAIIDLDDFKFINDIYGHEIGDRVLRKIVAVIKERIRRTDFLIRYVGDEFLLIMPGINEEIFEQKLWELQRNIHMEMLEGYKELRLSVSIGGVMAREQMTKKVIARAEKLLYQAKKQKNIVITEWSYDKEQKEQQKYIMEPNKRQKILIVDDSEMNRMLLCEMLGKEYDILEAADGVACMKILEEKRAELSLVLLDIVMPGMNGYEVLGELEKRRWMEQLPVIMISSEDSSQTIRRVYDMGASDYISRPFDAKIVYRRVTNTIKLYARQRRLTSVLTEQIRAKEESRKIMVAILSQIVEFRNGESGLHVQHINVLTKLLMNRLLQVTDQYSIEQSERELIVMASSLHDIGKIGVPENVLNKSGKLTKEEFEVMKSHTLIAASILENLEMYQESPLVKTAYQICRWHHERYDGKGYPDGLYGEEIPISAQIVSLADVYDALVSERVYKNAYSHEDAYNMIMNGECGQFNPLLLKCLEDIKDEIRENVYIPGGGIAF